MRAAESAESEARDHRATESLLGLATADAYGNRFFNPAQWGDITLPGMLLRDPEYPPGHTQAFLDADLLPEGQWSWTDDTEMACGIVAVLRRGGHVDQDVLARHWANHYQLQREYGTNAIEILSAVRRGENWKPLSQAAFDGAGSQGNGAAMRVAPLGAWFADDLELVVEQARLSCEITHFHPDAIAGGVAVAVAAATAAREPELPAEEFIDAVVERTPEGEVHDALLKTRELGAAADVTEVALALGNGRHVMALDTVPLCVWAAAVHRGDYPKAVRCTVSVGGDMDTSAAIVGGIVAAGRPDIGIPDAWLAARESLPGWL